MAKAKDIEKACVAILDAPRNDQSLAKLTELALDEQSRSEARETCLKILKDDSNAHRVRLILSKTYYLDQMAEFCVRELLHLKAKTGGSQALDKLLSSFADLEPRIIELFSRLGENDEDKGESAESSTEEQDEEVVAELDIDVDIGEVFDDIDSE